MSILDAIAEGERLKDQGIQRAADKGESDDPGFKDRVKLVFKEYVMAKPPGYQFFLEDFRLWCKIHNKIEMPSDSRSFAFLTTVGQKEGWIVNQGQGKRKDPVCHRGWAAIWMVI